MHAGVEWSAIYWTRMFKLLRLVDVFDYVAEFIGPAMSEENVMRNPIFTAMSRGVTVIVFGAHLAGCLFYTVGTPFKCSFVCIHALMIEWMDGW